MHKPWVDEITWPAADGGTMRRVPEVIDTWFDSGAMPYAQWHYPFEHRAEFEAHFPADYICEGIDQTRGWFYSLLAISTAVFDRAPYRNVIVNELVLDAQGKKMSKSVGNVVNPWDVIATHGADAARLYLLVSSQVWQPKRFDASQLVGDRGEVPQHVEAHLPVPCAVRRAIVGGRRPREQAACQWSARGSLDPRPARCDDRGECGRHSMATMSPPRSARSSISWTSTCRTGMCA